MARLTLPDVGTVVHVEGDLEDAYRAAGWVDTEPSGETEKPKQTRSKRK